MTNPLRICGHHVDEQNLTSENVVKDNAYLEGDVGSEAIDTSEAGGNSNECGEKLHNRYI